MRIQLPKTDPKTPNFGEIWRNLARMAFFVTVDSTIIAKNQFSGVLRPKESSHAFCIYLPQRGYKSRLSGGSGVSPICLTCLTWLALSLHTIIPPLSALRRRPAGGRHVLLPAGGHVERRPVTTVRHRRRCHPHHLAAAAPDCRWPRCACTRGGEIITAHVHRMQFGFSLLKS